MTAYRVYFLGQDKRVSRSLTINCENDEDAIRVISEQQHSYGIELWDGSRFVKFFPP
jgi:hypothetical protein